MRELIEEGRRLEAKATKGPWDIAPTVEDSELLEIVADYSDLPGGRKSAHWIAELDAGGLDNNIEQMHANAHLIVWLRNNLSALLSLAEERPDWQPIATAPKDGTEILLWEDGLDEPAIGAFISFADVGGPPEGYHDGWYDTMQGTCEFTPTHWQPLPKPPASLTPTVCTCRHDSGASSDCGLHNPAEGAQE